MKFNLTNNYRESVHFFDFHGCTIHIANMGDDSVSVINLASFVEEKKIEVGSTPVTAAITTDGKTLLATLTKI